MSTTPVSPPNLAALRAAFAGRLMTDAASMAPFLTDWRRLWSGPALAVAQPDTTADVAAILRWCQAERVAVVPQGGNTGLSGGSVPQADMPDALNAPGAQGAPGSSGRCIVLSLTRMNRVRALDAHNNTFTLEAGVTLLAAQQAAEAAGRLFPLSLAAQGTCTVGGNLATNAGGVQVLRYGNTRELCLGLEVVTAEGEIWNGLRGLRKDNTGYDLRDLYIGSEGTLGVITAAVFKLFPRPAAQAVALVAVPSPEAALALLQTAQARCGAQLTAFELMSRVCLDLVLRHMPAVRQPLQGAAAAWFVLLEVSVATGEARSAGGDAQAHASALLEDVLASALETGEVEDAAISSNLSQFAALWALRENISEAQGAEGKTIKHDVSVPISRIPAFIHHTSAALAAAFPQVRLVVFGHMGDGNLHFNLSPAESDCAPELAAAPKAQRMAQFLALERPINTLVHDAVVAHGGSISAEHGLGVLRRDEAARWRDPVEHALMRRVKAALDPLGLMNPGKVLPA